MVAHIFVYCLQLNEVMDNGVVYRKERSEKTCSLKYPK